MSQLFRPGANTLARLALAALVLVPAFLLLVRRDRQPIGCGDGRGAVR